MYGMKVEWVGGMGGRMVGWSVGWVGGEELATIVVGREQALLACRQHPRSAQLEQRQPSSSTQGMGGCLCPPLASRHCLHLPTPGHLA